MAKDVGLVRGAGEPDGRVCTVALLLTDGEVATGASQEYGRERGGNGRRLLEGGS